MGTTNAPCRFFLGADVGDFLEHVVTRRDVTRPKTGAVGAVAMTVHLLRAATDAALMLIAVLVQRRQEQPLLRSVPPLLRSS
jgi:hypothetical protein